MMNFREKVLNLAKVVRTETEGVEFHIVAYRDNSILTRFADTSVHQNMIRENTNFSIFLSDGERFISVDLNSMDEKVWKRKLRDSLELLKLMPKVGFDIDLKEKGRMHEEKYTDIETLEDLPSRTAKIIEKIFRVTGDGAYGSLKIGDVSLMLVNSNGLEKYTRFSPMELNLIMVRGDGSAHVGWGGWKLSTLEEKLDEMTENVVKMAENSRNQVEIELGEYGVILPPEVVSDIAMYTSILLCDGKLHEENLSPSVKLLGKEIGPHHLNLLDDPEDEELIPFKFDLAGTERKRFKLIEDGKLVGLMFNFLSSLKYGKENTGHTVNMVNMDYSFPMNLVLKSGEKSISDIMKESDGYIYISRFHYTNIVNPMETLITGLTRDGTFILKDGKFEKPLKNMRFNFSIIELFRNIEDVSKESEIVPLEYTGLFSKMPYLKIRKFRFTSS